MAALIAVNNRLFIQRNPVLGYQQPYRLQHKIHFKGFAQHIGKNLFRASIQDRGKVAMRAVERNVSDVCRQNAPRPVLFKFTVY